MFPPISRSLTLIAAGFVAGLGAAAGIAVAQSGGFPMGGTRLNGGLAGVMEGTTTELFCASAGPHFMVTNNRQVTGQQVTRPFMDERSFRVLRVSC